MVRTADSFQRKPPKYKVQPTTLIVCEDSKSSLIYLEEAAQHFRAFAKVQVFHPGKTDPLGIVNSAIQRTRSFDHVYCVIDRDDHHEPRFREALLLEAANDKITVLTSYPCFEFWLLLHFGYTRAPFMPVGVASAADRVLASLTSRQEMRDYKKGNVVGLFAKLLPWLPAAMVFAPRTVLEAKADNEMNPSTPLHELILRFEELGKLVEL